MRKTSRENLEKALHQSRRAVPRSAVFAVVGFVMVWGLYRWTHQPFHCWVAFPALGLLVGNVVNIAYCRWVLRRLG